MAPIRVSLSEGTPCSPTFSIVPVYGVPTLTRRSWNKLNIRASTCKRIEFKDEDIGIGKNCNPTSTVSWIIRMVCAKLALHVIPSQEVFSRSPKKYSSPKPGNCQTKGKRCLCACYLCVCLCHVCSNNPSSTLHLSQSRWPSGWPPTMILQGASPSCPNIGRPGSTKPDRDGRSDSPMSIFRLDPPCAI